MVSDKRVSERFGHSTINVTADRYLHVTPTMDRSAAEAVGELLRVARGEASHTSPLRFNCVTRGRQDRRSTRAKRGRGSPLARVAVSLRSRGPPCARLAAS